MEDKLKKAIKNSGNNLHIQVADYLGENGWIVNLSPFYYDDTMNKPREIDIIAKKEIIASPDNLKQTKFHVFLYIECKYFKEEIAFRIQKDDSDKNSSILMTDFNVDEIFRNTRLSQDHHYFCKTARLYDTSNENQEKVFNAITQPIKSYLFFNERKRYRALHYPVVIYDGIPGIYAVEGTRDIKNLDDVKREDMLVYICNYSYKNSSNICDTKNFCVDFVSVKRLEKYLDLIEKKEVSQITKYLDLKAD